MRTAVFSVLTLMIGSISVSAFAINLNCKSLDLVDGWKGVGTNDFLVLMAEEDSNTKLIGAKISGAYETSEATVSARSNYIPKSKRYVDYNKFESLADAWHSFDILLPKDYADRGEGVEFKGYVQVFNESGFLKNVAVSCTNDI
jgi:hypothetical protein